MEHRQMRSCWDGKNHPPSQLLNLSFKTYIYYQHAFKATVLHFLTFTDTTIYTGCSKKKHKSFAHDKFSTSRCRIALFASKWSAKIVVYQSMQNLYKLVTGVILR